VSASQAAPQACSVVGGFEIDGDMMAGTVTCASSGLDWNSSPPLTVEKTNQGGTYKTAGKDGSDPLTWQSSGSTPNKTDFSQAYATSHIDNNHFFGYVAWERTDTTGTQGYAIEVDNSPARVGADGTPQPDRSNGGTVFYLSANGSNPPIFNGECTFTSQATYGTKCDTNPGNLTFAVNQNQITDPISNTTQIPGSFFEVALDITGLNGVVPSCPGAAATTVYLRSITGQTSNGNLKGYMKPLSIQPDSTCVAPPIVTTDVPGGNGSPQPAGSLQNDTVNVGDPTGKFGSPTPAGVGSVKFFLCSPTDVASNNGDCSTGGTQVGGDVPLDVNGQATSGDVSGATSPNDNANGTYCWRAEFTPKNDTHYKAGSHTNSNTECFTIFGGTPSVSTNIAVTGNDPPNLGFTTLGDKATLSPLFPNAAFTDGETVNFNLYGPYAGGVTPDCQAAQLVFSTSGTLSNGTATTSATYTPTAAGTYVWIASYPKQDAFNLAATGSCSDANESAKILAPNLSLAKTADAPTVDAGGQIGFTITASNSNAQGTGTAKGVTINDPLPGGPGVDWSIDLAAGPPASCEITGVAPNQTLTCGPDDLAAGASESVHVISGTDFTSCALYANTASANADNIPAPIKAGDNTTVQCPNLSLSKTADNATVNAGDQIGFTIQASNAGPGAANGVVLDDPLPAGGGVDWSIDADGTSGPLSCSVKGAAPNQDLQCTGTLASDQTEIVHVISGTDKTSCQAYPNTVTLNANADVPQLTASATTTVLCPHIQIVKTADAAQVNVGSPVGFTLTVFNDGLGDAHGVTLSDTLPTNAGLDWSVASQGAGWDDTCAIAAGKLTCGPVTVPHGTTQTASTFTVHITSPTTGATGGDCPETGVINNTGAVTTSNDGNGSSSASTCVQAMVDLSITKSGSPASQTLGDGNITWTMVVTNNGPSADTGVKITDPMPTGNTFVSATISKGSCTGGAVLNCTIGDMAVGESVTITLITTPTAAGTQTNTAAVSGDRPETNTTNNQATASVEVGPFTPPQPCIAVSKVTPKQLFVGRKTKVTIHLTQGGKAVKGIHVRITGPKVNIKTGASNGKGLVVQQLKMKKAGVLLFSPIASKRCNTQRVGVTNVFTPPVTG
jgi:uncharacterized repeat protein (TIGR01451 family)